jgi:hypothetical protein
VCLITSLSHAQAPDDPQKKFPAIKSAEFIGSAGSIVVIKGVGFCEYHPDSYVEVDDQKADIVAADPDNVDAKEWNEEEIKVIIPLTVKPGFVKVKYLME